MLFRSNQTGETLDRVVFYAMPNMLRRQNALMYEAEDLEALFPTGYAPGGIDLRSVKVNGADAEYGFQGEDELYLRVACDLGPGESAVFEFDYYLLLSRCNAFIGAGDTDVRLKAFYFIPGAWDSYGHEFVLKKPLPFTRWLYCDAADFQVKLTLPAGYIAASTGIAEGDSLVAENVREFALAFGKRYRVHERETDGGVKVRVFSGSRSAGRVAEAAAHAVEQCEAWFGEYPVRELDIAQSDYPLGALNAPGIILLPGRLMGEAGEMSLRFCAAQQIFGLCAYPEPSADAWLSDSVSSYVSYLMLEDEKGRDAFLSAINRDWVSALQLTIPGGLTVTSDASLFTAQHYDIVILRRGAVVLHELRVAMGLDELLAGLAGFVRMGESGATLTEMDFVHAMDAASGRSWEAFLTDWAFNVDQYVNQQIDWYE